MVTGLMEPRTRRSHREQVLRASQPSPAVCSCSPHSPLVSPQTLPVCLFGKIRRPPFARSPFRPSCNYLLAITRSIGCPRTSSRPLLSAPAALPLGTSSFRIPSYLENSNSCRTNHGRYTRPVDTTLPPPGVKARARSSRERVSSPDEQRGGGWVGRWSQSSLDESRT